MMDFPLPKTPITGPASWLGPDMAARPEKWLRHLTTDEIAELEAAAKHFLALGKDVGEITKEDFPLPHFSQEIYALREKLLNDVGVEVFRGLPTETYTQEFMATVFCGIGAHLGSTRSQNAQGHILGHVRDIGADANDPNSRIYQTSERQTFHTDSADVVCLLCIRGAQEGGKSLLVSAMSIYNKMLAERPELLPYLFDPIATDRRGEIPEGAKPFMEIPVLNWFEGKLTVFYQRQYIDSALRFPEAMRLTDKHIEALDLFDSYANDPDLNFAMQLQPGDMQFVYNHSQLHDRTGFLDWPDLKMRRHLFRLWISVEGDRPLPECFKERYGSIEIGKRGGIITEETKLVAPLD